MGCKKELTSAQRGTIFYLNKRGESCRSIAKAVGCGSSTVFDTLKRYGATGSTESRPRSGRPPVVTTNQRRQLKRLVTSKTQNRRLCTAGVQELWKKKSGKDISVRTVGRALRSTGLRNCVARKKPLVSTENQAKRLAWCHKYAHWTTNNWSKVLWSDEATFSQFEANRNSRVWREPDEKWSTDCVTATVKHSPSVMHWGCFSRQRLGRLVPLRTSVTGTAHVKTLQRHALPTMRRMFPDGDGWFQEDNASPHRSKVATAFRTKSGLRTLTWPAQSPDLNPIENLWAIIKNRIRNRRNKPSSLPELERLVQREWKAIPRHVIENLVDSMPRRIQAVIAAQGGPTKY
jgi:transposase